MVADPVVDDAHFRREKCEAVAALGAVKEKRFPDVGKTPAVESPVDDFKMFIGRRHIIYILTVIHTADDFFQAGKTDFPAV